MQDHQERRASTAGTRARAGAALGPALIAVGTCRRCGGRAARRARCPGCSRTCAGAHRRTPACPASSAAAAGGVRLRVRLRGCLRRCVVAAAGLGSAASSAARRRRRRSAAWSAASVGGVVGGVVGRRVGRRRGRRRVVGGGRRSASSAGAVGSACRTASVDVVALVARCGGRGERQRCTALRRREACRSPARLDPWSPSSGERSVSPATVMARHRSLGSLCPRRGPSTATSAVDAGPCGCELGQPTRGWCVGDRVDVDLRGRPSAAARRRRLAERRRAGALSGIGRRARLTVTAVPTHRTAALARPVFRRLFSYFVGMCCSPPWFRLLPCGRRMSCWPEGSCHVASTDGHPRLGESARTPLLGQTSTTHGGYGPCPLGVDLDALL